MGVRRASLVVGILAALTVFAVPFPTQAAVVTCTPETAIDPADDVQANPEVVPDAANGFNRLDIQTICITEDATSTFVTLGVGAAVNSIPLQEYHWRFNFKAGEGALQFQSYAHKGGAPSSSPSGTAQSEGARIQFTLAKSAVPVGSRLNGIYFNSTGTFIDSNGNTFTGSDRGPNGGAASVVYVVGTNAPAGTDTDKDGVDDRAEVQRGTDPGKADTDGDGLSDGDEASLKTDPTKTDSDGDGLPDGQEKGVGADPTKADTDGDGLNDKEEASGSRNQQFSAHAFLSGVAGSTNPSNPDTDGDNISDGDEVSGRTVVAGILKAFTPTDPNAADTDGDGLSDLEEITGLRAGTNARFPPTDPTKKDTDGDGTSDFAEVEAGRDPTDADDGGSSSDALVQYLPFSLVLLALVVLVSAGGILWRWG